MKFTIALLIGAISSTEAIKLTRWFDDDHTNFLATIRTNRATAFAE